jgi:hypothetical protein
MSARPRAVVIDVWNMRQTRLSTGMSGGEALHPGEKKEIKEISGPPKTIVSPWRETRERDAQIP